MLKFYHHPHCKKSRAVLHYLRAKEIPFEIIEYIKHPLSEKQIEKLLVKLNIRPKEIFRKQEEYFKKNLSGKNFHDHEWIRILSQNPRLLIRPILELDYKAIIGDSIENIELLLNNIVKPLSYENPD